jgi:hypothetical protein
MQALLLIASFLSILGSDRVDDNNYGVLSLMKALLIRHHEMAAGRSGGILCLDSSLLRVE